MPASGRSMLMLMVTLLLALPAMGQFDSLHRLGFSAAADRFEPNIAVHGDEVFELHVIVVPPDGASDLGHAFSTFHWAVMQYCCGGAATILSEDYNPACQNDGGILSGIVTTFEPCVSGEVIHIATIAMQMVVDDPGQYLLMAAPLSQAITCAGQTLGMSDLMVAVDYTSDITPVEVSSWTGVKALFR